MDQLALPFAALPARPAPPVVDADALSWSRDDLLRFTRHADPEVREWAERRFALVESLGDSTAAPEGAEALPVLAEALAREAYSAALVERIGASPAALRELAGRHLGVSASSDVQLALLHALRRQPFAWATQLLCERLEKLVQGPAVQEVYDALAELGDTGATDALLAEWYPGEWLLAHVIRFLSQLGGSSRALDERLLRDAEENDRLEAELKRDVAAIARGRAVSHLRQGPLRLRLRCRRCLRSHHHEVGSVLLHPAFEKCPDEGWDGVTFGRFIVCKRCGAEDDYEIAPESFRRLMLMVLEASSGGVVERSGETLLRFGEALLWDGKAMQRPAIGLARLRARTEAEPRNGEAFRRLGNFLERHGRRADAREAWSRACEVDPTEVEAAYGITAYELERGATAAAASAARLSLSRIPSAVVELKMRVAIVEMSLRALRASLGASSAPSGIELRWAEPSPLGGRALVRTGRADLAQLREWPALGALLSTDDLVSVAFVRQVESSETRSLDGYLANFSRPESSARARSARVGRNEPCPCGSGRKSKRCCAAS